MERVAVYEEKRGVCVKKPEEVKEGVKKCLSGVDCFHNCPYAEYGRDCVGILLKDLLEYVESLERKAGVVE